MSMILSAEALALAEGRHDDPFSILGWHQTPEGGRLVALVPGAEHVWAISRETGAEAELQHVTNGLFSGKWDGGRYRLRARNAQSTWDFEDAYAFGPVLGEIDEYLIGEGTHRRLWQVLGAHVIWHEGIRGVHFAVWAPSARRVSVVGNFNIWDGRRHQMRRRGATGVWEIFVPGLMAGEVYKYEILSADGVVQPLKADPVGFGAEHPPQTASQVRELGLHLWGDGAWIGQRQKMQDIHAPISIYEVHLGSWRRVWDQGGRALSYHELAGQLVDYVVEMGFTHIELLPITEFPFDGSWGYQPIGLYAPTIRHGRPEEFAAFVDAAHRRGVGVILDWVPGHFPTDDHGLRRFDGTALYEHADPKEGFHQDWNTLIYNYGRREVKNFLLANALFWLEEYHLDGLRVDAVASMLYRDYSRRDGEWVPNIHGGRENLEAIDFLKEVNAEAYGGAPGIMTVAEESTAFPGVTRPVHLGGLGFGYKWNMGWMNDSLRYFPAIRSIAAGITTNLPSQVHTLTARTLSCRSVTTRSFTARVDAGQDAGRRVAEIRQPAGLLCVPMGASGQAALHGAGVRAGARMGASGALDWHLLDDPLHRGMQALVRDLNKLYRDTPALHWGDCDPSGFDWIEADDAEASVYVFERRAPGADPVVVAANLTPLDRTYRIGLPQAGTWCEIFNSDSGYYGGANWGNLGAIEADEIATTRRPFSAEVYLPPLSVVMFTPA
ncbi:1,4-alpha-glucan branching protein GlgB [Rhodobacter capsulatus]